MKLFTILTLIVTLLYPKYLLVIGNIEFPKEKLTKEEIKAIFLGKHQFIAKKRVLIMNYKYNSKIRICFEKSILEKSKHSLERYWRKAYYQGKHPPKVISSTRMLILYLKKISPSIGYIDENKSVDIKFKTLFRVKCNID